MRSSRNYYLLLGGQFLGAFGDNVLLKAILGPLTYLNTSGAITQQEVNAQNSLFNAVFFVPFIVLAPLVGFLNDRMPKTSWLFGGNALKVFGTAVGLAGVWMNAGDFHASRHWQVVAYGLVAVGACVYSPAKYGILPEILPAERLVKANGTVEMLTLVAILSGLISGATLYDHVRSLPVCYAACGGLYLLALTLNGLMDRTPHNPASSFTHSLGEFGGSLWGLISHRRLGRILLGSGLFWFSGAILRTNLQAWGLEVYRQAGFAVAGITNERLVGLMVGLIIGIVSGSVLAGQLHKTGDLRWARRYGFLMACGILLLGLLGGRLGLALIVAVLVAAGLCGGLLVVPLNAALQNESDHSRLGKTIAIQNFIDYFFMLFGAGFLAGLTKLGATPMQVFLALPVVLAVISLALRMPAAVRGAASSPR